MSEDNMRQEKQRSAADYSANRRPSLKRQINLKGVPPDVAFDAFASFGRHTRHFFPG